MDLDINKKPIGVFDSGIGGITVLASAINELPGQKFIYYGDSANAPYGVKSPTEIIGHSINVADLLVKRGVKALVVACNTATSVAINILRARYDIPVIGMEPALKFAVEKGKGGSILVMATPLTIKEKKFNSLLEKYIDMADVMPISCPGLVELIETGNWEGRGIDDYLRKRLLEEAVETEKITDVVLGCTHYIFIKEQIKKHFAYNVNVLDGNEGTVRQLKKILIEKGLYIKGIEENAEKMVEINFSGTEERDSRIYFQWIRQNSPN